MTTTLTTLLQAAKTELAAAEALAVRAGQAQQEAVAQQLRLQGRIAVLDELLKMEAPTGQG